MLSQIPDIIRWFGALVRSSATQWFSRALTINSKWKQIGLERKMDSTCRKKHRCHEKFPPWERGLPDDVLSPFLAVTGLPELGFLFLDFHEILINFPVRHTFFYIYKLLWREYIYNLMISNWKRFPASPHPLPILFSDFMATTNRNRAQTNLKEF